MQKSKFKPYKTLKTNKKGVIKVIQYKRFKAYEEKEINEFLKENNIIDLTQCHTFNIGEGDIAIFYKSEVSENAEKK